MSYTIFKTVKQNNDGTFQCFCASSNVFNDNWGYVWESWCMTYFNKEFPTATNAERKALWMLISSHTGDKFYQTAWKNEQKLANKFIAEKGIDTSDFYKDKEYYLEKARQFLEWKKELKATAPKKNIKSYNVRINNTWVAKKTSRRCFMTPYHDEAKVFKKDLNDLKTMFDGYSHHHLEFVDAETYERV